MPLLIRVLGPVEVRRSAETGWVEPPRQQQLVAAILTSRLGQPCRLDELVEALWPDGEPATAHRLVQGLVSRFRYELGPDHCHWLRTVSDGWRLDLPTEMVDVTRFELLAAKAAEHAEAGAVRPARQLLEEALALWRDRPFAQLADHPQLLAETARLDEAWLQACEELSALRLRAGEADTAVVELQELVVRYPLRERLWKLLIEALDRSGRRADALASYQRLSERLVDELGVQPGPELQQLHATILRREPSHQTPGERPGHRDASPSWHGDAPVWPCRRELPLVARDAELAALHRAFEASRRGERQVVLVGGEAGSGRTRLVAEFAEEAIAAGAQVMVGTSTDGAPVPFGPFVRMLRSDLRRRSEQPLDDRTRTRADELSRLLPDPASGLERCAQTPSPTSDLDRQRWFDAVAGWLVEAASHGPVVAVLEDLHAAAVRTVELLRHVVEATVGSRLLLVCTFRDTGDETTDALADTVARLVVRPDVSRIHLGSLPAEAVGELVAARRPELVAERWAEAVRAAAGGNPRYVEELLHALDGTLPDDPAELLAGLGLPHTIAALVAARLRRLSPAARRFLQQAAVAGDRFDFAEVLLAASLPEGQALDALDEAVVASLVLEGAGHDEYRFAHGVTRAALLEEMTQSRRRRLRAQQAATSARQPVAPERLARRLAAHHR